MFKRAARRIQNRRGMMSAVDPDKRFKAVCVTNKTKIWAPKRIFGLLSLLSKYCWTFLWETDRRKMMLTIWHLGKMDMVIAFHLLMNIISDKCANCFPRQDSGIEISEIWARSHSIIIISQSLWSQKGIRFIWYLKTYWKLT